MRSFNTSGSNIVAQHYTLPRLEWIERGKPLVDKSRCMGLTTATYLIFVNSTVTHKDVIEKPATFEDKNVLVTTYLIPYDLETDF